MPALAVTEPAASTPDDVARAQKQLAALQWAIPALTAVLIIVSSLAGEQQRASEVKKGILSRVHRLIGAISQRPGVFGEARQNRRRLPCAHRLTHE